MTLEEFIDGEMQRLARFAAFWQAGQAHEPAEIFPNAMNPGEWDEQLRHFESA